MESGLPQPLPATLLGVDLEKCAGKKKTQDEEARLSREPRQRPAVDRVCLDKGPLLSAPPPNPTTQHPSFRPRVIHWGGRGPRGL